MKVEKISIYPDKLDSSSAESIKVLKAAIQKAQDYLLRIQNEKGYWVGELEADASVSAGYIALMYFMYGRVEPEKQSKVIHYVKSKQNADGSWSTCYGGPGDLNVTVQVYFDLKLAGVSASESWMQKARDFVLSRGGVMQTNTIARIWLALFGQFDYRGTPAIPPELIYLPTWFYLNIYEFASWSRETIMALILILNTQPVCRVPNYADISELYVEPPERRRFVLGKRGRFFSWRSFFLTADSIFKFIARLPLKPLRRPALRRVERWVVDHQEIDGSWGGIMLPWVYSLMALKSLGYENDHPVIQKGLAGLAPFLAEDGRTLRLQPATSPVWDTVWAALALRESGLSADHPALVKSGRWLIKEEVLSRGDWTIKNSRTSPGCWSFEFINEFYPDIDDTAMVARTLLNLPLTGDEESRKQQAIERGYHWVLDMQSRDGGWAAFDRDNNKQILASVPYADFMTPLDPTSADVTAHAIELISKLDKKSSALKRAIEYLKNIQEPDGAWYGRWGVNYIYGTGLVLVALRASSEDLGQKYIYRAVDWLLAHQNSDGGWGETCESYTDPALRGCGPSTASQTAWALMGLLAGSKASGSSMEKGIHYLLQQQKPDGSWAEEAYTGTGFPRAFYLRYDLYRIYFPLLILSQYRTWLEGKNEPKS